jgi:hypothetical protein
LLLAGCLTFFGTPGSVSKAAAAEIAPRATLTDVVVRFDRRVETRSVREIVDAVNTGQDALLSSRLQGPSAARRLLRREPTEYERNIIAKYPTALLSQLFEFVVLTYDDLRDLEIVASSLRRSSSIRSVERVHTLRPAAEDPLLGSPGQSSDVSQWGMHALSLPAAWSKTKGRATIAYLDGGLATSHEDLQANYRPHLSRNLTTSGVSSDLEDNWVFKGTPYQGHGTHVAGILAATNENGTGVSGACPRCSLIAVKDSGLTTDGLSAGIEYAVAAGAQVLNISATFEDYPACTDPYSPTERSWCVALGYAHEAGISILAAAGNAGGAISYAPANSFGVIAVGGLQPGPLPSDTSGSGTHFWRGDWVEKSSGTGRFGSDSLAKPGYFFLAPAARILSTYPAYASDWLTVGNPFGFWGCGDSLYVNGSGYGLCTGTSMASPHVAAIAGLIRSVNPLLTYQDTAALLQAGASDVWVQTYQMLSQSQAAFLATQVKPDASAAVQAALDSGSAGSGNANRRTPLFGFHSPDRAGHFYTTNPQAASSAVAGNLIPSTNTDSTLTDGKRYKTVGYTVEGYNCFPMDPLICQGQHPDYAPRAFVEVYTTEINPFGSGDPTVMLPLYRLSKAVWPTVRYTYETSESRKSTLLAGGWKVDGIEGYVLDRPRAGAALLCRKYNGSDYVLFPGAGPNGGDCSAESDCHLTLGANCGPDGYTQTVDVAGIGYVFPSRVSLTVSRTGFGTGTVTSAPAGIDCGSSCSANFDTAQVVSLAAVPMGTSSFTGWSGACTGAGSCQVTMDTAANVTASFTRPVHVRGDVQAIGRSGLFWREASPATGLSWWTMNGWEITGSNYFAVAAEWQIADVGDLDGDGKADIVWRRSSDGATYLWTLDGLAPVGYFDLGIVAAPWVLEGVADLNSDGRGDLLWRNGADGTLYAWLMSGNAILQHGVVGNPGVEWSIVDLADVNGDGRADIVGRRAADGAVAYWTIDGLNIIGAGTIGTADPNAWTPVAAADFNGDGKADLLWRSSTNDVVVWILNGGVFAAQGNLGNTGSGWTLRAVADLDGDGKADLVWRHTDGSTLWWKMNGTSIDSSGPITNPGGTWQIVAPE